MTFSYRPDDAGDWLAAAAPACLALVRGDRGQGAASKLWASLAGGAQGVLDDLTSAGLFNAPPFALLTWRRGVAEGLVVSVIVRGEVSVRLSSPAGLVVLSGLDRSTWLEQSLSGVTGFVVECGETVMDDATDAPSAPTEFPLVSGLVRARWVSSVDALEEPVIPPAVLPQAIVAQTILPQPSPPSTGHKPVGEETIAEMTLAEVSSVQGAETGYDHLFGATMMRGVEQAAVRPGDPDAAQPESESESELESAQGDTHDGLTIMSSDLHKLRGAQQEPNEHEELAIPRTSPPGGALCLILPDGSREALGRPILVGRAPSVSQVSGEALPRLISLAGTDQDISRNHVRFAVEGDTVVVTDLNSRNGTVIVLPGKVPQKLRGGEATSIIVGTVIDLGGGVALTVGED